MRQIVPTQVLAFIDSTLPKSIKEQSENPQKVGRVDLPPASYAAPLQMIVRLVDRIPTHLINVADSDYFALLTALEAIRSVLAQQNSGYANLSLERVPGLDKTLNPVTIIRQILLKCPDNLPSPQSHQLAFIQDAAFRGGLQSDITSIERALNDGEWKGATVLAGSVIEAVLLWALEQKDQKAGAGTCLNEAKSQHLSLSRGPDLVDWDLHCYVLVADGLKIIEKDTRTAAGLAKNFRNLIHPGKAVRQQQQCDRGTAFGAVGALDHVVRDVEKWNAGQP